MKITDHLKQPVVPIGQAKIIKELNEKNEKLLKQVEFLQFTCREAGTKIKDLQDQLDSLRNPLTKLRKGGL